MKHIRRKFTTQHQLPKELSEVFDKTPPNVQSPQELLKPSFVPEDYVAWLVTDRNVLIKTFRYKHKNNDLFIPEPDPVLVYFNNAEINLTQIEKIGSREKLLGSLREVKDATKIMHNLYDFLGQSSSFIVFSFMSMECLVNKIIPDDYKLRKELKTKTEEYNIDQLQRKEFNEKLKEILPEVTGKSFWKDHPKEYEVLLRLKELRDEITHTKKQIKDDTYYQKMYAKTLDFDFKAALSALKDFINYYSKDLVEECDCGADF